ncbi:hypothetical protein GTQ43_39415 [Nostoc sp. KVJ3]|uniref:hypothetical protein n=1 Tax=Nostoc sp. KVJ3 TaxID=457945 RepID=UPI002237AD63|nr:hypothetical protein [Nostoc sp. KVJ3]MCW5319416.1 hypothetical protein [Nostoc sp. KVJ3]
MSLTPIKVVLPTSLIPLAMDKVLGSVIAKLGSAPDQLPLRFQEVQDLLVALLALTIKPALIPKPRQYKGLLHYVFSA